MNLRLLETNSLQTNQARALLLGCILSLVLIISHLPVVYSQESTVSFYVFSDSSCGSCEEYLQQLEEAFPTAIIIFIDLYPYEQAIAQRFQKICELIDVDIFYTPLVGAFINGSLKIVGDGPITPENWERVITTVYDGVPFFSVRLPNISYIDPIKIITNQDTIALITQLFTEDNPGNGTSSNSFLTLLPIILTAAAVDAFNPCEFGVLVILLTFVLFRIGKKAVLKTGLAFSLAIFIIYLVMGIGLFRGLTYIPQIKYIIFLIAFIIGTLHIMDFLGKKVKRIPHIFENWILTRLEQTINPKTAFLAGTVTALLLLPCTSGPYILILNLLSENASFIDGLTLLLLYHAIIITPFIIITVSVHTVMITTRRLKKWSLTYQKWINLFSGIVMILLSLFILLYQT